VVAGPLQEWRVEVQDHLAELLARHRLRSLAETRAEAFASVVRGADRGTKTSIRRTMNKQLGPLPRRHDLKVQRLREWGVWQGPSAPSRQTLHRFRWSSSHQELDEHILRLILPEPAPEYCDACKKLACRT
jgi:hypothetical protein